MKDAIHVLGGGDAICDDSKRLPLDGRPNPVEDEASALALNVIGLETKPSQDVHQRVYEFGPGGAA